MVTTPSFNGPPLCLRGESSTTKHGAGLCAGGLHEMKLRLRFVGDEDAENMRRSLFLDLEV